MSNKLLNDDYIEREFKDINLLAERGELVKARKRCEALFRVYPENPRVMHGMGLLRYRTGDLEDGETLIRTAIENNPGFVEAYQNLGRIFYYSLRLDEAEEQYRKAIELVPDDCKTLSSLALVLIHKGRCREALALCEKVLAIDPCCAQVYGHYGNVMMQYGRPYEGIAYIRKALSLEKNNNLHSSLLFALNLLPESSQREIFEESQAWGRRFTSHFFCRSRGHFNYPDPERKLRIGYVSGDFRTHPVGYHLRPVLAAHDKSKVDVFLYNAFPNCDAITEEFAGYADCYRDISLKPDEKVESIIREDGIDILVDLAGHTAFNRLMLFARRPAPIQVSWIGYFNTTGMEAMDYFLSDLITTPPEDDACFVEKVIRLPDIRFCYEPQSYAPEVAPLPSVHNQCVTFGSFNAIHKMLPDVVSLWSRVLLAVPGSRLLLKSKSFKDELVVDDFNDRFANHGITRDRIELRLPSPHAEMLAEYGDMDISLDTFPYNGGATTCESLWMGVPVVTLAGRTPIGRQTKAYLQTIGHPEWVAQTPDEFVEIAQRLAADSKTLALIRSRLRLEMSESPVCDGKRFAHNLEATFRQMWRLWCADLTKHQQLTKHSTRRFSTEELCDIGFNYLKDNECKQAEEVFNRVLNRDSRHIRGLNGKGRALEVQGHYTLALRSFRRALKLDGSNIDTNLNLGCFYLDQRKYNKAYARLCRVVELQADHVEALLNLGIVCKLMGRSKEACQSFEKVLEIKPDHSLAQRQIALILSRSGDIQGALQRIREVLCKIPDDLESLYTYVHLLSYADNAKQSDLFDVSTKIGKLLVSLNSATSSFEFKTDPRKERLRIGFVSADYVHHPVGMLLVAFFREYNPEHLSLYCYNNGKQNDYLSSWYRSVSSGWHDIYDLDDDKTAELIQKDEIDILIDLSGYTDKHRLAVFARRPAPVQVAWLGYWHTTGLPFMDYIIADEDFIRPEDEQWFSEKVVRLPHNRFCYVPPVPHPEVVESPFVENGHITFGCFNNPVKISDHVIQLWVQIMKAVPRSRLILKFKTFNDKAVRQRFSEKFSCYGISPRRVEFRAESNLYLMMAELGDVDICLEPFPFCGGMTSLHSLWMGVPMVTLDGEMPVSRQSRSFLKLVGLSDLVARNYNEYLASAVKLANDPDRLIELRESLRERMLTSPLCDTKQYAASLESLFFRIWKEKAEMYARQNKNQINFTG